MGIGMVVESSGGSGRGTRETSVSVGGDNRRNTGGGNRTPFDGATLRQLQQLQHLLNHQSDLVVPSSPIASTSSGCIQPVPHPLAAASSGLQQQQQQQQNYMPKRHFDLTGESCSSGSGGPADIGYAALHCETTSGASGNHLRSNYQHSSVSDSADVNVDECQTITCYLFRHYFLLGFYLISCLIFSLGLFVLLIVHCFLAHVEFEHFEITQRSDGFATAARIAEAKTTGGQTIETDGDAQTGGGIRAASDDRYQGTHIAFVNCQ